MLVPAHINEVVVSPILVTTGVEVKHHVTDGTAGEIALVHCGMLPGLAQGWLRAGSDQTLSQGVKGG